MNRVQEPTELMDEGEQAAAYAASDFSKPHEAFVTKFSETFPSFQEGLVADLCCGPADPTIRFARRYPKACMVGFDGAESMLALARKEVEKTGLKSRIIFEQQMLPISRESKPGKFDVVLCNGSMHHLPNSQILWETVKNIGLSGTIVFVVDLIRPATIAAAEDLVRTCTQPSDPALMKRDFYHSLLASFRPEEIWVDLEKAGLSKFHVEVISNRHMMIYGRLP